MLKDGLLAEQTGEQRHQRNADQRHTAASHELFDTLGLCAGVVVAITFHEVNAAPDRKACAERDHEGLKNTDCRVKKRHEKHTGKAKPSLGHGLFRRPFKNDKVVAAVSETRKPLSDLLRGSGKRLAFVDLKYFRGITGLELQLAVQVRGNIVLVSGIEV